MPEVRVSITVNANKSRVYQLAKNMERFPEFMPDVESVKVVERVGDTAVTEWASNIDGAPINWRELDRFDDAEPRIEYKLIEGDLDKFEGEWIFVGVPDGTLVTLTVEYELGIPELEGVVGPVLREKVLNNAKNMLEALKQQVESTQDRSAD